MSAGIRNVENTFNLLAAALKPAPTERDVWVGRFEEHADWRDDETGNPVAWIRVETAADVVVDAEVPDEPPC